MVFLHSVSGFFLFFELPIPLYWIILHPFNPFWRPRVRTAFWFAGLFAWTTGGILLWHFRFYLMSYERPSWFSIFAGFALIFIEIYLFARVERELGTRRLVGHAELTGTGEFFAGGLYAYVRHPRYTGMFCAVIGSALLSGTDWMWITIAWWFPFALIVIGLEERELMARFGPSYEAYRKRVPAFIPLGRSTAK
ncbi:MAG TPA: isoprenylcysteine carboxylmethyltransferase family protein [Candidatus Acidoferrales bacterium]|jgi:protein-S-isoprenylcysteine O-methyltransferase Ste14|nr:isoprenylcysteine carboxylmethyltransferase family protein [Candidatus Acidoferrales bacterium]